MSNSLDSILSDFVSKTSCEPAFGRDLLQNVGWDVDAALVAFSQLTTNSVPQTTLSEPPDGQKRVVNRSRPAEKAERRYELESTAPPAPVHSKKTYHRGLSFSNSPVVTRLRNAVQYDLASDGGYKFSDYSFILPDFSQEEGDYQEFLRKDLVNTAAQVALENAGVFVVLRNGAVCVRAGAHTHTHTTLHSCSYTCDVVCDIKRGDCCGVCRGNCSMETRIAVADPGFS